MSRKDEVKTLHQFSKAVKKDESMLICYGEVRGGGEAR